jgi:hypothetical protein
VFRTRRGPGRAQDQAEPARDRLAADRGHDDYGRELFGALVPYGKIWCPCADDATTIELSAAVKIDGHELAAGKYSVWTVPTDGKWTIIFNRQAATWHTKYPEGQDALRLEVTPRTGAHMETMAFYFPMVEGKKAELVLHWGTTVVPVSIEVP